jgi:hypothetical protein
MDKTIARSVERDRSAFLEKLVKARRSTSPQESKEFIHVDEYLKIKDQLMAEKVRSREFQKEMLEMKKSMK